MAALFPMHQQDPAPIPAYSLNDESRISTPTDFNFSMPPTSNTPGSGMRPGLGTGTGTDPECLPNLSLVSPVTPTTSMLRHHAHTQSMLCGPSSTVVAATTGEMSPRHLGSSSRIMMPPRSSHHRLQEYIANNMHTLNSQSYTRNAPITSTNTTHGPRSVSTTPRTTPTADHDATQAAMLAVALQMRAQIRHRRRLQKRAFVAGLEDRSSPEKRIRRPEVVRRWVLQLPYLAMAPEMVDVEAPRDVDESNFSFGIAMRGGGAGRGTGSGSGLKGIGEMREDAMYAVAREMIGRQFGVVDGKVLEELLREGESDSESMEESEEEEEEEDDDDDEQCQHQVGDHHRHQQGKDCECDEEDGEGEEEEEEGEEYDEIDEDDENDEEIERLHRRLHNHLRHHRQPHYQNPPRTPPARPTIEPQLAHQDTCTADTQIGTGDINSP